MSAVKTTCPYCGVGCGVMVEAGALKGDPTHPANFGRLCSKGAALAETWDLPDRLLVPEIGGRATDWNEALDFIAQRFHEIRNAHGPDAIAFYVSGQFLTEDYYVANKLMKGFIGSANIDTNSRLCMASSVAGHVRAFGEDVVPGCYNDLEEADLVVLVGSNMAWCHPVLYQRLMRARETRGTKIVVIDPRRTSTAETADLTLNAAPGLDTLLFNGLLAHLARAGVVNRDFVVNHVSGCEEAIAAAARSAPTLAGIADASGVSQCDLLAFYDLFAKVERVVTLYSQGVNQSSTGADKVNAILNCHLATGRIGRPGMGPFSLTGQPNAMGGREVGGLANQLAAHMAFTPDEIDRVQRFWKAPAIAQRPGLKAVDLFQAVGEGRVKAVWIAATNPAASMPRADLVRKALSHCPLVIVSDAWPTDTTSLAHVVLPAATWGEKEGSVTNSERRISRQRRFRSAPGSARPDWWMFAEIGRRMGWTEAFDYGGPADIFREHAALSAFENDGARAFDIGRLADLDDRAYGDLAPVLWPQRRAASGNQNPRLFAHGGFSTPDRRARMIPISLRVETSDPTFPLRLNTGRVRDQWHTMTRTGRVPRLMTHSPEPTVTVNSLDARHYGLVDGGLARVKTAQGSAVLRVSVSDEGRPGDIFIPMHWTDQFASCGPVGRLVHALVDPISGQPDLKGTQARVIPHHILWSGQLIRANFSDPMVAQHALWSKRPIASGALIVLSGWERLERTVDSESSLRELMGVSDEAELVSYSDPRRGIYRYAALVGDRLDACVFFARSASPVSGMHRITELIGSKIPPADRLYLLAGLAPGAARSDGKIVCSCFSVTEEAIVDAIRRQHLTSHVGVGEALRAGTNCGSCIPELKKLIAADAKALAPA